MDTSVLAKLFMIAPDLMEEVELRTLVLERVAALGPIGRRALAQRLHLAEREVRSASDALRSAGCITQSAAGMELTDHGKTLVETARTVSRGRRSLAQMELALSRRLDVERVRMTFSRSLPVNGMEEAELLDKLRGLVDEDVLKSRAEQIGI